MATKIGEMVDPSRDFSSVGADEIERIPNVSALLKEQAQPAEATPAATPVVAAAETESCGNCYFMKSRLNGRQLAHDCREESPRTFQVMTPQNQMAFIGAFPPTTRENWCGKWEPKAKR